MNVEEIQPALQTIVQGITLFSAVQDHVRLDDGQQNKAMETDLKSDGLTILIMAPTGIQSEPADTAKGFTWIDYSTTVWIRTDPKIKAVSPATGPRWNPLTCEKEIIKAVMQYSKALAGKQYFRITKGAEPETDFTDTGNFSRFVRFETRVVYQ